MNFDTVNIAKEGIFEQINGISPVFQLHDLISQEIDNIDRIINELYKSTHEKCSSNLLSEHGNGLENVFVPDESHGKEILDNRLRNIENLITTDKEIDVIKKYIDDFGLNRQIELEKGNSDIEFF